MFKITVARCSRSCSARTYGVSHDSRNLMFIYCTHKNEFYQR